MLVLTAAAVTPGTAATPLSSSSKKRARRAGSGYFRSGSGTRNVRMRSGSNPRETPVTAMTLRIIRLAPTSSITERATAPTTSVLRKSACVLPPVVLLPLVRSGFVKSFEQVCSAGARPKIRLVANDTSSVNPSTGRLTATSDSSGIVSGGTSVRMMFNAP